MSKETEKGSTKADGTVQKHEQLGTESDLGSGKRLEGTVQGDATMDTET